MSGWNRRRSLADAHRQQPERDREDFGAMQPHNTIAPTPQISGLTAKQLIEAHARRDFTAYLNSMTYRHPPPRAVIRQSVVPVGFHFEVRRPGTASGSHSGAQQAAMPSAPLSHNMPSRLRSGAVGIPDVPSGSHSGTTSGANRLGMSMGYNLYRTSVPRESQQQCGTGHDENSGLLSSFQRLNVADSRPGTRRAMVENGKSAEEMEMA
ncbi:MAG: hypothetical protein M1839_000034 [Geoglossum umbratile]|nr:MAG: hypothetical protein M1839_000034 [Geoglossum umbratile]